MVTRGYSVHWPACREARGTDGRGDLKEVPGSSPGNPSANGAGCSSGEGSGQVLAAAGADFAEHCPDVVAGGMDGDEQRRSDVLGGQSIDDQPGHLPLAAGEAPGPPEPRGEG